MADIDSSPFSGWLEGVVRDMYTIEPQCIQLAMRDVGGKVYTAYWQLDANDLACIIDAMKHDGILRFIQENRDSILEILNEEEGDEDGLCESDTEADSTG